MEAKDKKFKEYVNRMVANSGFRPAEGSEHRWHVDSECSDRVYDTIVSGKSVLLQLLRARGGLGKRMQAHTPDPARFRNSRL